MAADVADQTISLKRGQDRVLTFTLDPKEDVTGWTIAFAVRRQAGDSAADLIARAGVVTDGPGGRFTVTILAADTASLAPGRYEWDVWRTDSGFNDFLGGGPFEVEPRVRG